MGTVTYKKQRPIPPTNTTYPVVGDMEYFNGATGQMTKTRYTDSASTTSDVRYHFNKARQMTKLTDWTGDQVRKMTQVKVVKT
jgi:hypothetical protein